MAQAMIMMESLSEASAKYNLNIGDITNIVRAARRQGVTTTTFLSSKYTTMWLACTRYLGEIRNEEENEMCTALENLCAGKYTTRKGALPGALQQAIQQACGPDLHSCFEQNCYYTGIVPCMRCWQVFYCSNDCRQRDWDSRHSETCSFLFSIPLSSCDNKKRKLTN